MGFLSVLEKVRRDMSGRGVARPGGTGGEGKSVLVCYASRYGSTKEIAECIADEVRCLGMRVDCLPAGMDVHPGDYDAIVLGSPIYMGKWLVEARDLVSRERVSLGGVPVAVFSVGYSFRDLSGKHLQSGEAALSDVRLFITPRDTMFFPGRMDPARLSPADEAIYTLAGVVPGDFRDMEMVRAWTRTLPATLGLV